MIGAIIGDIVGSRFEFNNHRSKDFELFDKDCSFTDDSIMSLAVCDAILKANGDYKNLSEIAIKSMQKIGRNYPDCGYGGSFLRWMFTDDPKPYNSFGNGAAMRIGGCGFAAISVHEAQRLAYEVTEISHDHPEGLKGAEAVATAVFLARSGHTMQQIRDYIESHYYKIDFTLDEIRDTYAFNETCQNTVPQAFEAFFEAKDFEDSIRNAISIGGDSDTLAAITGAIAEAYFGVPESIRKTAIGYLDKRLIGILTSFEEKYGAPVPYNSQDEKSAIQIKKAQFEKELIKNLISFIEPLEEAKNRPPYKSPLFNDITYDDLAPNLMHAFLNAYYAYSGSHSDLCQDYLKHCKEIDPDKKRMDSLDVTDFSLRDTVCYLTFCVRADRFCDGALYSHVKSGFVPLLLKKFKELTASVLSQ